MTSQALEKLRMQKSTHFEWLGCNLNKNLFASFLCGQTLCLWECFSSTSGMMLHHILHIYRSFTRHLCHRCYLATEQRTARQMLFREQNSARVKDLTKHLRGGENNDVVWRFLVPVWHFWVHLAPAQHQFDALHSLGIKMPPSQPPRHSKNWWTLKGELNNLWCHEIAGEHIGLRLHDASRQEHLHLPGGPWEAERSL